VDLLDISERLERIERAIGSLKSNTQKLTSSKRSGGKDDWRTPRHVVNAIEIAYGPIAVDPCASPDVSLQFAQANFIERHDEPSGLDAQWNGLAYVNPPFSGMSAWTAKVIDQAKRGAPIVMLARNSRAAWFRALRDMADGIIEHPARLKFNDGNEPAPFDVVFFVFNLSPMPLFLAFGINDKNALIIPLKAQSQEASQ